MTRGKVISDTSFEDVDNINYIKMEPMGDTAISIRFGDSISPKTHEKIRELTRYLDHHKLPGVVEYVPAFTNVTIYYDCIEASMLGRRKYHTQSPYKAMEMLLHEEIMKLQTKVMVEPEIIDIPVCYGGGFGPDLEFVANHNNLSMEEVIRIHSEGNYLTYMVGFAPGFPYLGGLSEKIAAPRRESPRLEIPAGTVGIAGNQTGVYPIGTPGGWQLIGRTPKKLFRPEKTPPSLIKTGDMIRFRPISIEEFEQLQEEEK